jgi:signal transduction histidine kinase
MNEMLERVETSVTHQQRFVADASHELRNPLTRIRASLEVELAGDDPPDRQLITDLLEEVIGLQHMVEDMLYLARADAGKARTVLKRLDLDDLLLREARGHVAVSAAQVSPTQTSDEPSPRTTAVLTVADGQGSPSMPRSSLKGSPGSTSHGTPTREGPGLALPSPVRWPNCMPVRCG